MPPRLSPLALALLLAAPLAAQPALDATAAPRQGTIQADDGRLGTLDLQIAPEAPNPLDECPGYLAPGAPDAAVEWNGEGPLRLWVRSATDAVLVVRAPTGETLCEDDTEGVQPAIEIAQARPGRYAVWVGAYTPASDASLAATLYAGPPPPPTPLAPEAAAPPLAFTGDDASLGVTAGGDHATASLGLPEWCPGFIDAEPTARVSGAPPYYLTATAEADLVLAVRDASGEWLCNDDGGLGTDPALLIEASGEHAVWVGTFRGFARGDAPEAVLTATGEAPEGFGESGEIIDEPGIYRRARAHPLL